MLLVRGVPAWLVGEFLGTFLLIFFGCGSVAAAVTTGAQVGIFQVAIVWGLGIATAIYLTAPLSGSHLNPAVTLAFAVFGGFPARRVAGYIATQFAAAFVAAAVLYVIFGGALVDFEMRQHVTRGEPGSEASAMIFGEYYPSPGGRPLTPADAARMPEWRAFLIEVAGTAVLLLVIFGVTDANNPARPRETAPVVIGLTVTLLISLLGPLTMGCFNPVRDLAPRLFSSLAGWGAVPFSVNGSGWWTVYLAAPMIGGLLGGAVYRFALKPAYAATVR
jgi:glycerol uptake facilitator protein